MLKEFNMITAKSAKSKMKAVTAAAVEQMSHITTNQKIAGAAVLGVAAGAAATALGSAIMHNNGNETGSETTAKAKSKASKTAPKGTPVKN
jgi:hypothetical protein